MRLYKLISLSLVGALTACTTTANAPLISSLPDLKSDPICETPLAGISIEHETAKVDACRILSDTALELTIRPENTPINDSPWYGFRVDPKQAGTLRVTLKYKDGTHRYDPKVSYDGRMWNLVPESRVIVEDDESEVDIRLKMDTRPFFVSAQEIFSKSAHDAWAKKLAQRSDTRLSKIGASIDGHPIMMLEVSTHEDAKKPYVMWVGRQHPPEVTGALALIPFTDTVLGESDLAREFRDKFNILIVPMMNPDGVTDGHWRHNKGGLDLNRDWGPFTQPETRAVKNTLTRFENGEDEIALFLDFHSTWKNVLYTQADDEPTSPPMFAKDWTAAVKARLADDVYPFSREGNHNSGRPISKNYMFETFGIAAITYEVGDDTNRDAINTSAKVFAEEMMRLMLADAKRKEGGS